MNKAMKSRWLVDFGLFVGFMTAFFMDLTGLMLHQWIGVSVAAVATFHLVSHWKWVKLITQRFSGKTSGKSRLFYLIDVALMLGLVTILITGLVISSWLNLTLLDYPAWLKIHIFASISTLLFVLLKLALHWRWIVAVQRQVFSRPSESQSFIAPELTGSSNKVDRRGFLRTMGVVGVTSILALSKTITSLQSAETVEKPNSESQTLIQLPALEQLFSSNRETTCAVHCNRRCSYPGHCHKYRDANGNGRCDLGECI